MTKSFYSKSNLPAYQVHRIDQEHGKQTRSALGRRPRFAIASTSTSGGSSNLSPSGNASAHAAGLARTNSSEVIVDGLDSTALADVRSSATPPSVTKPAGPSDEKIANVSNVRKALFQTPSPERGTGAPGELAPPEVSDKVVLPLVKVLESPLEASSGTADKNTNKRGAGKKNK